MYQRAYDRIEDSGYGKDDRCKIQCHRERKIQADRRHHPFGKPEKMGKFPNIIIYQGDICRVHRNITSDLTHGDAYTSFF